MTVLGFEAPHFHDLRHEATSRLFQAGYIIPEVAQFTPARKLGHAEALYALAAGECGGETRLRAA